MSLGTTDATPALLAALVSGSEIKPQLARESGYDVVVLQRYMDLAAPHISRLDGFKPLLVWLRGRDEKMKITSSQDLKKHSEVLQLFQLYENVNKEGDGRYAYLTVEAYVSQDGTYIIAVSQLPDDQKQADYPKKERQARVAECTTADELAGVLQFMRLQTRWDADFHECYWVRSPLLKLASGLRQAVNSLQRRLSNEAKSLQEVTDKMKEAFTPTP